MVRGILTNWFTIRTRVERLKDLESKEESGYLDKLPKKETALLKRELDKLRKNLNGIKDMKRLPDLVLIVDQKRESTAIQECMTLGIPIISILDSNCNPDVTDIPIPGNDDAIRSIKLIVGKIADSICEGRRGMVHNEDIEETESLKVNLPIKHLILNLYIKKNMVAEISAKIVKELRDKTSAGMMDCKKALQEANGDFEKAEEALKKKGLATAEKKIRAYC